MSAVDLQGKRVLIPLADAFMGPVLCEVFAEQGARVIESTASLVDPRAPAAVIDVAGTDDAVIDNLKGGCDALLYLAASPFTR